MQQIIFFTLVCANLRFGLTGVLDFPKNRGTSRHSQNLHKTKTNKRHITYLFIQQTFLKKVQHGSQYQSRHRASDSTTFAQAGLTSTEADTWILQSRDTTSCKNQILHRHPDQGVWLMVDMRDH